MFRTAGSVCDKVHFKMVHIFQIVSTEVQNLLCQFKEIAADEST